MYESLTPVAWLGFGLLGIALLVGIVLTILNVRDAKGPKERRFVRRACAGIWALVALFIAAEFYLGPPHRYIAGAVFIVLVPLAVYRWAMQHQMIREIESRERRKESGEGA
jgi:hypothetical protein